MAKARPITGLNPQASPGTNARVIARTRLEEMHGWKQFVDSPFRVAELHNLRIAAKRLRYTLEIFADSLPKACAAFIKEAEQIQEELGALHDSDVMIALLRLCLGSLDSGSAYEYALAHAAENKAKGKFILNPAMVAHLLNPDAAPSAEERHALELLLHNLQQRREEQYNTFRQHWHQLEERDFQSEVLQILDQEEKYECDRTP
jgi:CHAD domain-containing protein